MKDRRAALLFVVLACAWGASYTGIEIGLRELPVVTFAAIRVGVAGAVVVPAVALSGRDWRPRSRADVASIAVAGTFVAGLATTLLFLGQTHVASGVSAVLFSLNPVVAAAFAAAVLPDARLDAREALGVLVGLAGIVVVAHPNPDALAASLAGDLTVALAAACLAFGSVLGQRYDADLGSTAVTGWALLSSGVVLGALAVPLGVGVDPGDATLRLLVAVGYVAVVATAVGYPAYFALLDAWGPVRTNLVSYVVPLVATAVGAVVLDEPVTAWTLAGFAVVAAGFALVNYRTLADLTDRASPR